MEDLFLEWLNKKDSSDWVKRALIDSSYKKEFQREKKEEFKEKTNTDLATYGDAVIKLCYMEILLDNSEKLTEEKSHYESDKYLVENVAKHYDLLKYISKDNHDSKIPNDYYYEQNESKHKNKHKYIATAVEAMIGAIYKEEANLESIKELLKKWMSLNPYAGKQR